MSGGSDGAGVGGEEGGFSRKEKGERVGKGK